jgi:hypothetical protein
MAPATRNLTSVGRADEVSSREYAPQKPDRPHTRASVALRMAILDACSPTLSVLVEGGMRMVVCNVSKTVHCAVTRSSLTSSRVVVLHSFLSFSIDTPMVHLFKLIELSLELSVWY